MATNQWLYKDLIYSPEKDFSNLISLVRAGNLRALALAANTRHAQAPEIPTANESGLPGFEVSVWFGFVAPAGTPKALIDRLNIEIANALHARETIEHLTPLGLTIVADSPESNAAGGTERPST